MQKIIEFYLNSDDLVFEHNLNQHETKKPTKTNKVSERMLNIVYKSSIFLLSQMRD